MSRVVSSGTKQRDRARSAPTRIPAAVIHFLAPLPPTRLRRNSQARNVGYLAKLKRDYSEDVYRHWLGAGQPGRWFLGEDSTPWARATLRLTWRSIRKPPDRDNALASVKVLVDSLRLQQPQDGEGRCWLGIFQDDKPECLVAVSIDVEKLAPADREREGIWVEVERA